MNSGGNHQQSAGKRFQLIIAAFLDLTRPLQNTGISLPTLISCFDAFFGR